MVLFFVFGRMLAVDAQGARLWIRLVSFLDPSAYSLDVLQAAAGHPFLTGPEARALLVAALFIGAELLNARLYGGRSYHLMRRPVTSLVLALVFILAGTDTGALLYARI